MRKYKYFFVKVNGEWMRADGHTVELILKYVTEGSKGIDDSFAVYVEANNWKEAKKKAIIAGELLKSEEKYRELAGGVPETGDYKELFWEELYKELLKEEVK